MLVSKFPLIKALRDKRFGRENSQTRIYYNNYDEA